MEIEIDNRLPKSVVEQQQKYIQIANIRRLAAGTPLLPETDQKHIAVDFLKANKTSLPFFRTIGRSIYNGVAVEVDDDDSEDFLEKVESAGFRCEYEQPNSAPDRRK